MLGQFLCKQDGGYPKYLVLRERLLLKLEYLLEMVHRKGYAAETFAVLSGFRTPFYNHAIRNVKYSRHQWGGAADIFIDVDPQDGVMDDLDGNGKVDVDDALLFYKLIDAEPGKREYEPFIGGLGLYGTTTAHGPFVHVDARGFRARWGAEAAQPSPRPGTPMGSGVGGVPGGRLTPGDSLSWASAAASVRRRP